MVQYILELLFKEQQLLFIYLTFTGVWVPEDFHSHTRHVDALVRLRSKPNEVGVNWEQQFMSNRQISNRTSHEKLKRNPEKKNRSDCFILRESSMNQNCNLYRKKNVWNVILVGF